MARRKKNKKNKIIDVHKDEPQVCIICLAETDDKLIQSRNSAFLIDGEYCSMQVCTCNIAVHKLCMESWIHYKYACPICLTSMQRILVPNMFNIACSYIMYCIFFAVFMRGMYCVVCVMMDIIVISIDELFTI